MRVAGLRIHLSEHLVDRHEDWSKVRSPSRTLRRMRHNAARVYTYTPSATSYVLHGDTLVVHPVTWAKMKAELAQRAPFDVRDYPCRGTDARTF